MGQLLAQQGQEEAALRALLESLTTLARIGAAPDAARVAEIIAAFRQQLGSDRFQALWDQVTGGQPLPPWLREAPTEAPTTATPPAAPSEASETVLSLEQFLALVGQAAREGGDLARQLWQITDAMATDPRLPPEVRALGRVLLRILAGERHPDLSALPPELAEAVRELVEGREPRMGKGDDGGRTADGEQSSS